MAENVLSSQIRPKLNDLEQAGSFMGGRKVSEQLNPNYVKQTVKNSPSLVIWSCIINDHGVG